MILRFLKPEAERGFPCPGGALERGTFGNEEETSCEWGKLEVAVGQSTGNGLEGIRDTTS